MGLRVHNQRGAETLKFKSRQELNAASKLVKVKGDPTQGSFEMWSPPHWRLDCSLRGTPSREPTRAVF